MTTLKRKLALWLCPELGKELKNVTDHNEFLKGNIDKAVDVLDRAKIRVEELSNELSESQYEVRQLTAKLHLKEKALKKAQAENLQLIAELSIKEKALKQAHKYKLHKPRKV